MGLYTGLGFVGGGLTVLVGLWSYTTDCVYKVGFGGGGYLCHYPEIIPYVVIGAGATVCVLFGLSLGFKRHPRSPS